MEFFCFALPPAWKDAHPAGTDPREPVEFSFPLPRESWLLAGTARLGRPGGSVLALGRGRSG